MSILFLLTLLRKVQIQSYEYYKLAFVKFKRRYSCGRTLCKINFLLTIMQKKCINNVEEIAQYLHKSSSWVYKNWKVLGGRKLRGSLFFPSKEDLYERVLFKEEKAVSVRVHREGNQVHGNLVQIKTEARDAEGKRKEEIKTRSKR